MMNLTTLCHSNSVVVIPVAHAPSVVLAAVGGHVGHGLDYVAQVGVVSQEGATFVAAAGAENIKIGRLERIDRLKTKMRLTEVST
jgi:hypothetical protein